MQTRSAMTCLFYGRCRFEFVLGQLSRGPRSPVIQHEDVLAKQFQILHDDLALALAEEVAIHVFVSPCAANVTSLRWTSTTWRRSSDTSHLPVHMVRFKWV